MTNHIFQTTLLTPVGRIVLHMNDRLIYGVDLSAINDHINDEYVASTFAQETAEQFKSYFIDAQFEWTLPLAKKGTPFQRKVWQYLQTIPSGETRTYSDLAQALNTSARAVGNACRANPFAIVVPCHRVVSKTGIGGYYGKTDGDKINLKQWLLNHEHSDTL